MSQQTSVTQTPSQRAEAKRPRRGDQVRRLMLRIEPLEARDAPSVTPMFNPREYVVTK